MDKEKYIEELSGSFSIEIHGLGYAKKELDESRKKWVLVFKSKIRKEFYDKLLPKLYGLESEFNKKLQKTISESRCKMKDKQKGGKT